MTAEVVNRGRKERIVDIPYPVTIRGAVRGYVVQVGCREFVFENQEVMLADLGEYLDDPQAVVERYLERYPNLKVGPAGGNMVTAPRYDTGIPPPPQPGGAFGWYTENCGLMPEQVSQDEEVRRTVQSSQD
jgi:hypothetical protein